MAETRRQLILDTVTDLVSGFLYYDRKEDEDLPRGAIEEAVENGEISWQDVIDEFSRELLDES